MSACELYAAGAPKDPPAKSLERHHGAADHISISAVEAWLSVQTAMQHQVGPILRPSFFTRQGGMNGESDGFMNGQLLLSGVANRWGLLLPPRCTFFVGCRARVRAWARLIFLCS